MTLNGPLVRIAISGELSVAATGSTAPTNSTAALDAAFVGLGYVGEDGVSLTPTETVQKIRAWQNAAVVRSNRTELDWMFKCKLIETKGKTLGLYFRNSSGPAVVSAGQWSLLPDQTSPDERAFVFDVLDGTKHIRHYVPRGEVTERSEIKHASGEVIGYEVTILAYYDSTLGAPFKSFSDDSAWGYS